MKLPQKTSRARFVIVALLVAATILLTVSMAGAKDHVINCPEYDDHGNCVWT